ncbi:4-coumarate--CoA ligase 1-like [Belonocnema kinseyi]|uniref:4-coumarate--CoA ligase 1-like n=1 Tax=Belonocnema kinseyi TaxID=2817044 RepID=UPI00143DCDEC|nr:4-coumarate--CoA ligase 1-like [Belonocnema kinseyi]XP_033217319.1 4-coumarate--CoA ligase 1-like [Belonocnema kinseyi]
MKSNKNILSGPPFARKWNYKSVGDYYLKTVPQHGSATALISMETGEELTHKQLLENSLKLAKALEKQGLRLNDRIGICSENNLNFAIAAFSSIFLGTTICPLSPFYTERELIHTMKISKPTYIFVSISCLPRMKKIVKDLPWSTNLILLQPNLSNSEIPNISGLISKIPNSESRNFRLPEIDIENHVLLISASSGTTGLPKGVMLTHKNILTMIQQYDECKVPVTRVNGTMLGLMPFSHAYGFCLLMTVFAFGATQIIISKFEENIFLKAIEKYRIQVLNLAPPLLVFLAKSPIVDKYDLSSVTRVSSGAAPLSVEIEEAVKKRFKLPFIRNSYGLTETTLGVLYVPDNFKKGSIGILHLGVSAKVVPLDGISKEALGPNCEGELCFKGDNIMKGYCLDEKATKAAIDEDGFLHTGDVGYYDEDGYFFIIDRVKELIKYKGFQVPPAELESILLTHPKIRDAAVVGLPDEFAGELPLAFVVKKAGVQIRAEEIIKYVNERVSPQKRLRGGVRFIEAIPKNPSGKILRRELRNLLKSKL